MIKLRIGLALAVALFSAASAVAVNNGDVPINTPASARRMIEDLNRTYGEAYKGGKTFLAKLAVIEGKLKANKNDSAAAEALTRLIREASLANPLLDGDKILVIRRTREANRSLNSHTSATIKRTGWDNEISELSNLRGEVKVRTVYRHTNKSVMKHMMLHFDGKRIMFSGAGANGSWAVLDVGTDGEGLRELTPDDQKDVQWFDACYLPEEGYIVACSTAGMQGLPCENGGKPMVNLYRVDTRTKQVRQLTFEQDSDWHPRVHHNGRVLYLRWEYTDTPHYYSRYLFQMYPDGTGQIEHWGSGSYFPTAYVWARPIPGDPSKIIGIVSGHHAKSETGRLLILDPALNGARSISTPTPFPPSRPAACRRSPAGDATWSATSTTARAAGRSTPSARPSRCRRSISSCPCAASGRAVSGRSAWSTFSTTWPRCTPTRSTASSSPVYGRRSCR